MSVDPVIPGLATVVLAAGSGSRYGGAKQLAPIDGEPMLRRVLDGLAGVGAPQVVVLGAEAERVAEVVPRDWRIAVAADWADGPGASLRAGLAAAPGAEAVLITLGDLPWLEQAAVDRLLAVAAAEAESEAVRAFEGEAPGHPLLLRGGLLGSARAAPDVGMGGILARARVLRVGCDGLGVARDVDGPADLPGPRGA